MESMYDILFTEADFEGAPRISLKRGECLIYEGEKDEKAAYFIVSGSVEVQTECYDGTQTLLYVLKSGAVFGELHLMGADKRTASVYTAERTVLLKINSKIWYQRMQDIGFMKRVHTMQLKRYLETTKAASRLGQSTVMHRLGTYLMTLPEWHKTQKSSIDVILPSHAQLARMLNCTRERITVVMKAFYKAGAVIKLDDRNCKISRENLVQLMSESSH